MKHQLENEMGQSIQITLPYALACEEAQQIIACLESAGGQTRFVGGCVRDAILNHPLNDVDIATSLIPDKTTHALEKLGAKVIPTGIQHGTVTAVLNEKVFEITTLRRDIECFGRHAKVEFSDSFEEDASRRDFTINAMYCDRYGNVYDYFGGYDDLQNGLIRFVGNANERVKEDSLRILRFFRFYARFGKPPMNIEALAAISHHVKVLESLSGERIQKEMLGLLSVHYLDNIIETMVESQVLTHIALPCNYFASFNELLMLEVQLALTPMPLLRLAMLLRTLPDPLRASHTLAKRWRLSNHDEALLFELVALPKNITEDLPELEQKKFLRSHGKELFTQLVIIAWAEYLTKATNDGEKLSSSFSLMLNLADKWDVPMFPVTGKDLLALGFKEGKQVGVVLEKAEEWWEEQGYKPSFDDIIDYIKNTIF